MMVPSEDSRSRNSDITREMSEKVLGSKLETFEQTRSQLEQEIIKLCEIYGWSINGVQRTQAVLAILSHACERRIDFLLRIQTSGKQESRFDRYYTEKSSYSTLVLIDHLKDRLIAAGQKVTIATEKKDVFGTHDISIIASNPCRVYRGTRELMIIEVKGSMGISIPQLTRYLLGTSPLLLVRVITNQVCLIRAGELKDFLTLIMQDTIKKAQRLHEKKTWVVPGIYCRGCPDSSCPHHIPKSSLNDKGGNVEAYSLVAMPSDEFAWDLQTFLKNLGPVAERTAELVVSELSRFNPVEGQDGRENTPSNFESRPVPGGVVS